MTELQHQAVRRDHIVAREGWVFILLFAVIAVLFLVFEIYWVGIPLVGLAIFSIYFFRNPERVPPSDDQLIISPADGRIVDVSDVEDNPYTHRPAKRVGIFMSVFSVHVNRAPLTGRVENVSYYPGKFLVASTDKASHANERNAILLNVGRETPIGIVQIAGTVARRIVCYLSKGDQIGRGERLGLIRFGSRVDLYLPVDTNIQVQKGDRVKAGTTVVGRFDEE